MAFEAVGITKQIGAHKIVNGVDIEIAKGKVTVLIGPSGGGKSTLIRALAILDPPTSGTIFIDDQHYYFPAQSSNFRIPWPKLTVVFQQLFLWPHLTLRENIELPHKTPIDATVRGEIETVIDEFEMREWVNRFPNQVSNGQRQRAAIARAVCLSPSYILFDEITSALDVEQVGKVLNYLMTLKRKEIGILLVTHMLEFAKKCADKVLFMDAGRIVESGTPEVIVSPKTKRMQQFLSILPSKSNG